MLSFYLYMLSGLLVNLGALHRRGMNRDQATTAVIIRL